MANKHDLAAQAKQLGEQALKLANTARVQAGRYAQDNSGKIDAAIDKATAAVERKTGKDYHSAADKVKGAASKGAALLAQDSATTPETDKTGPAASWPDAGAGSGGSAQMPTIPTEPLSDGPQDTRPGDDERNAGSGV